MASVCGDQDPITPTGGAAGYYHSFIEEPSQSILSFDPITFGHDELCAPTAAGRLLFAHGVAVGTGEAEELLPCAAGRAACPDDPAKVLLGGAGMMFDGQREWGGITQRTRQPLENMAVVGIVLGREAVPGECFEVGPVHLCHSRNLLTLAAGMSRGGPVPLRGEAGIYPGGDGLCRYYGQKSWAVNLHLCGSLLALGEMRSAPATAIHG
jgi:hypothetical protein